MNLSRSCCWFLVVCVMIAAALAYPSPGGPSSYYYNNNLDEQQYDPEELVDAISNVLLMERKIGSTKRGLDLGMSRGMAGALSAKHLMGMAAANFAGGPGRKRSGNIPIYDI